MGVVDHMSMLSRRGSITIALFGIAFGLVGCGDDEAAQRKAFVGFLQTRIIDKPGIHVPQLSDELARSFGAYAKHYAVITSFNAEMDKSVGSFLPKVMSAAAVTSVGDAMRKRDDIIAVRDMIVQIRAAISQNLATAEASRVGLAQPQDLKVVYDAAFDRAVRAPAESLQNALPPAESALQSILTLTDYLNSHGDKVSVQGSIISTSDPKVQSQVNALLDDINKKSQRLREAQDRVNKLMAGG